MSTLWTPGGERPIRRDPDPAGSVPERGTGSVPERGTGSVPESDAAGRPTTPAGGQPSEAEMAERIAELRDQLAQTPAEVVIANHAYGLFELAALHLSLDPPQLDQARLAIDSLGYLVEGMGQRLGAHAEELTAGLAQLRMAYVQIQGATRSGSQEPEGE